jgi:hypothetical protein
MKIDFAKRKNKFFDESGNENGTAFGETYAEMEVSISD